MQSKHRYGLAIDVAFVDKDGNPTYRGDWSPTQSIYFGDLNDPNSEVSRLLATREYYTLLPGAGTKPKHFYLK